MINLDDVLSDWKTDSIINQNDLAQSSIDTATLHSKYLQYLAVAKLRLKKAKLQQKTLLQLKWKYYNGKMDQAEIESLGWSYDPFDGLKVMKGEMDYYYDSDIEIQNSEEKIEYCKILLETLSEIVETLRWRHQTISNIIKWKNFEAGG
jgi:hypothetical protein